MPSDCLLATCFGPDGKKGGSINRMGENTEKRGISRRASHVSKPKEKVEVIVHSRRDTGTVKVEQGLIEFICLSSEAVNHKSGSDIALCSDVTDLQYAPPLEGRSHLRTKPSVCFHLVADFFNYESEGTPQREEQQQYEGKKTQEKKKRKTTRFPCPLVRIFPGARRGTAVH